MVPGLVVDATPRSNCGCSVVALHKPGPGIAQGFLERPDCIGQFALADGSVKFIKDNISNGGQINPATGAPVVGDAYGRYGNIWGGAHEIQKIQGAATVVFN